jgi:hypothetical protein
MSAATEWGGWFRPTKKTPWVRLAEGPTYDAAWAALLDATATVRGGDLLVTRLDPNKGGAAGLTPRTITRTPACTREPGSSRPLRRRF